MDVVVVRVLLFALLPLLVPFILIRLESRSLPVFDRYELYLIFLFGLGVAGSGIGGFFGHIFLSDVVAQSVGWPSGSPFQLEMGFANLALGVLGILAIGRNEGFRTATVIAVTILGVGASLVHLYDIVLTTNLAPGNTIQNVANLARPAFLIFFLREQHRLPEAALAARRDEIWQTWQVTYALGAGWLTASVAAGFGLGFSFNAPGLGALAGVILGSIMLALQLRNARPA